MTMPELRVTRWGDSGATVVMIHGGAQGSSAGGDRHFAAQQRLAERGWQVVVPDRPGHGKSPDPGRPDDAAADGEWAATLLGDGAHLVGHSFGGCVALDAATRRPEAVKSLTLIEPAMQRLAMDDPEVRKFGLKVARALFLSVSPTRRLERFSEIVIIPPEIHDGADPLENKRIGKALIRLKLPAKSVLHDELAALPSHHIPLLVVTGTWSTRMQALGGVVATTGQGRQVVIESDHHFPHLASSGEFNDLLIEHMTASDRSK